MNKLTDFHKLYGNQLHLWCLSYIHNLQNKMHNFMINNEIPKDKICLCAQLRIVWIRTSVLLWVHVVQIDAFTVFVSMLWCPLWLPDEYDIDYFTPIVFCPYFIYVICKYLGKMVPNTISKVDQFVLQWHHCMLPTSGFNWFVKRSFQLSA